MVLDLDFAVKKDIEIFLYLFMAAPDLFIFPGYNEFCVLPCEKRREVS